MTELYIRDDRFASNAAGPRLTADDIRNILWDVGADPPSKIIQKPKGFIVNFRSEKIANRVMHYAIYDRLIERHLTPDLSRYTRYYREILISDIPDAIYDEESTNDIWEELQYQNNIKILQLTPF